MQSREAISGRDSEMVQFISRVRREVKPAEHDEKVLAALSG